MSGTFDGPEGDAGLVKRLKANKWTIFVLSLGLAGNIGLTRLGQSKTLSWHEVNEIRQYKEMVFGLILAQSGKAISRWKRRSDDDVGEGAVNRLTR